MSGRSVYEEIMANISDTGRLPHDFSLNDASEPNKISWAPGALDGGGVYGHFSTGNPEKESAKIVELLKRNLDTGKQSYIDEIKVILSKIGTLSAVDLVLDGIRENHDGIDPQKLIELGFNLAKESESVDLVKFGISLLGLFDLGKHESFMNVVATLALYDELTLYSVVAASHWSNGNGIIFWIAKRVDGWGKIHAMEQLEPETDEIRDWILRYGCGNYVMDAYLGLTCAVKGDLISVLRQDELDDELFESIAVIIDALLDEGPVDGISEYDHAEEALSLYIKHAGEKATTLKHLWHILNVRLFIEDSELENKEDITARCIEIQNKPEWAGKINSVLDARDEDNLFYACNTASHLGIDITAQLLTIVKENPIKYCSHAQGLWEKENIAAELIELYESVLPLDKMATGMGDYLFSDTLRKEHGCLDFILPSLGKYPLQGIKLIKTALNSRIVRERNMSCKALSDWVKTHEKPLADVSPELYSEIMRIYQMEVNEQTKKHLKKLLDGGFEDEAQEQIHRA